MYFGLTASLNHSKFDPTSPAIFIQYHPNVGEYERDPARGRGRGGGRGGRGGRRGGRDSGSDISDSDSDGRVHATESYRD